LAEALLALIPAFSPEEKETETPSANVSLALMPTCSTGRRWHGLRSLDILNPFCSSTNVFQCLAGGLANRRKKFGPQILAANWNRA